MALDGSERGGELPSTAANKKGGGVSCNVVKVNKHSLYALLL